MARASPLLQEKQESLSAHLRTGKVLKKAVDEGKDPMMLMGHMSEGKTCFPLHAPLTCRPNVTLYPTHILNKSVVRNHLGLPSLLAGFEIFFSTSMQDIFAGKNIPRLFSFEEEAVLLHHLLVLSDGGFGLTPKEFRCIAYEFTLELGKEIENQSEEVTHKFQRKFIARHPEVHIITPNEKPSTEQQHYQKKLYSYTLKTWPTCMKSTRSMPRKSSMLMRLEYVISPKPPESS